MQRAKAPLALLVLAAFLTPLIGGTMALETRPMIPGFANAAVGAFEGDLAATAHAILGTLVAAAGLLLLFGRKVVQVPNSKFYGVMLFFLGTLAATTLNSAMKEQSIQELAEWLLFGLGTFAIVAGVGRGRGPVAILVAIFASVVILARNGLIEYRSAGDPTWRIFAGWQQPNAVAGIFVVGLLLGVGLLLSQKRVYGFVVAVCCALIAFCLYRTQSKGGILAFGFGIAFLLALLLAGKFAPKLLPWLGRAALAAVLAGHFAFVFLAKMPTANAVEAPAAPQSTGALGRFAQSKETTEQSVGFRKLLYVTSMALIQENPVGYGLATFRLHSSKPGLVTQTELAHNVLVQLAVEASPVAPILLLALVAIWLELALRDCDKMPFATNALRFSIIAAVLATLVHAISESNLYTVGIGLTFFMLLGVGLQLSADAVSPEFAPKKGRIFGGAIVCLVALQLWQSSATEILHAEFLQQAQTGSFTDAQATLEQLKTYAPFDGETWYAAALTEQPQARLDSLKKAVEFEPLPRNLRALASTQAATGSYASALDSLSRALRMDPNNEPALLAKMKLEEGQGDSDSAIATAKRLVGVESTIYYKLRALPEIVPTESFEARLFLATKTLDPGTKATLLQGAVDGYERFLIHTWPNVREASKSDPNAVFGGISLPGARDKLQAASNAARELSGVYRTLGRPGDASRAEAAAGEFDKALAFDPAAK